MVYYLQEQVEILLISKKKYGLATLLYATLNEYKIIYVNHHHYIQRNSQALFNFKGLPLISIIAFTFPP